jgi:dual specificity tyrosine-phosphorylation-regulated kinase 2/3/4
VGKRRIYSVRDFTDKNGDPKVAANDGIIYRYEVLDIIGKGSFGQVFRVFDHKKR